MPEPIREETAKSSLSGRNRHGLECLPSLFPILVKVSIRASRKKGALQSWEAHSELELIGSYAEVRLAV